VLLEWGWGHLSAPDLQKIAARGVCDGLAQPLLTQLAALGQSGACPRNIQRQLFNRFCSSVHPDRLVKDIDVEGSAITSMILPHELFNEIRLSAPQQFVHRLGADEMKCREFWECLKRSEPGREFFSRHEHLRANADRLHRTIPLVVHMDAGPYSKSHDSVVGFSMSSPLGVGSESETVFMIGSWLKNKDQ
jgi:hypothetical protein